MQKSMPRDSNSKRARNNPTTPKVCQRINHGSTEQNKKKRRNFHLKKVVSGFRFADAHHNLKERETSIFGFTTAGQTEEIIEHLIKSAGIQWLAAEDISGVLVQKCRSCIL